MEHVDSMILSTLTKLNCSFCQNEGPSSLENLVRDDVVEGIVRLLWAIDPNIREKIPQMKLPVQPAQKFQVATLIANTVNECGLKDPIGYHALLYTNIFQVRRIFITLIEKLPKEKIWMETNQTPFEKFKDSISEAAFSDYKRLWTPEFCRYFNFRYDGRYWQRPEAPELVPFRSGHFGRNETPETRNRLCQAISGTSASLFPFSAVQFATTEPPIPLARSQLSAKPAIPKKPVAPPRSNFPAATNESVEAEKEVENLATQVMLKKAEMDSQKHEIMEFQYAQNRLEDDIIWAKENIEASDFELLECAKDPHLYRLNDELAQIEGNVEETQKAFESTQRELEAKIDKLKLEKGLKANNLKQQVKDIQRLIDEKTHVLSENKKQISKLSKKINGDVASAERIQYQSQIIEIMATVQMQHKERQKIYQETCTLDKEVEQLGGNLSRTYSVVDGWMLNVAGRDGQLQRAYRNLITMHERCLAIRAMIEECGSTSCEIDDLLEEISVETQNAANIQLEELMADIGQIALENEALSREVAALKT